MEMYACKLSIRVSELILQVQALATVLFAHIFPLDYYFLLHWQLYELALPESLHFTSLLFKSMNVAPTLRDRVVASHPVQRHASGTCVTQCAQSSVSSNLPH